MTSSGTRRTFADKWTRNPTLGFAETSDPRSEFFSWILTRNGFSTADELSAFLSSKRRILDAGCGNGRVSALLRKYSDPAACEIVAIDLVAAEIARTNLAGCGGMRVLEADILGDLSHLGRFDFIYCQEVLHHTKDPEKGLRNLADLLVPGGEIAIYVYRKKAPIREYTDEFIRERIKDLDYDSAIAVCRGIAELGRVLAKLRADVEVPDIDILEIERGRYDVQRLFYHFFMKCFWSDELSPEENAVINFDWYSPADSSRHTLEEVCAWFAHAELDVVHRCVDHYGITVRGRRSEAAPPHRP